MDKKDKEIAITDRKENAEMNKRREKKEIKERKEKREKKEQTEKKEKKEKKEKNILMTSHKIVRNKLTKLNSLSN